jgi:hypothetical protein
MSLNLADLVSLSYYAGVLTCRKILKQGAPGFATPAKEAVLRIFIALKNPWPRPSLNPRTLVPMASTINFTPPKRLRRSVKL